MATANTAGHTKKVITNAVLFLGYCTVSRRHSLHRESAFSNEIEPGKPRRAVFLPLFRGAEVPVGYLEHDCLPSDRGRPCHCAA